MRAVFALGVATAAMVIASSGVVHAQCEFVHPARAKQIRVAFVPAYFPCSVSCGPAFCPGFEGRDVNAETREGLPSCFPAETFADFSGTPPSGSWRFGPLGAGTMTLAVKGHDLAITVALKDVTDQEGSPIGSPVKSTGHLTAVVRETLVDPVGGPMTVFDWPFGLDVPIEGGVAKVKTTLATLFAGAGVDSPLVATSCKSFELVGFPFIRDSNGAIFATVGLYLP
jgi:hypothetical protein